MTTSGYQPIPLQLAGGLNLRDAPNIVDGSQALDCLNVIFTERGALKSRDGYTRFTSAALTNRPESLEAFYTTDGQKWLIAGCGTRIEALNIAGEAVTAASGLVDGDWDFTRYGEPNSERIYAANGFNTIQRFDGSWSAPTATVDTVPSLAMPQAGLIAVDADENRMVATGFQTTNGGPNGTISSPSHVYFSEPGDPESWLTENTVQLRPGDGERIMGIVPFRDLIFVFKETCFFVFYSTSTDLTGGAVFNYRTVLGAGMAASRAVCATREGVYFMGREGVYRTEGGEPELISELIDPIWLGSVPQYFRSLPLNHQSISECSMGSFDNRIYLGFPSGSSQTNDRTLVFDPRYGWWSIWDTPMGGMCKFRTSSNEELLFTYPEANQIGRYRGRGIGRSDDTPRDGIGGNPIPARWRSAFMDFGSPNVKKIRQLHLHGSGVFRVSLAKDWETEGNTPQLVSVVDETDQWQDGSGDDTWGDGTDPLKRWGPRGPIVAKMVRGIATRGKLVSVLIESTGDNGDLWADGTDEEDTWGGTVPVEGETTTDLWGDGTDPDDVWGDGTDEDDVWGPSSITAPSTSEGSSTDLWGPIPIDPFTIYRLELHLFDQRRPSVVRTEA